MQETSAAGDPHVEWAKLIVQLMGSEVDGNRVIHPRDLEATMPAFDWVDGLGVKDGKISVDEMVMAIKRLELDRPDAVQQLGERVTELHQRFTSWAVSFTMMGLVSWGVPAFTAWWAYKYGMARHDGFWMLGLWIALGYEVPRHALRLLLGQLPVIGFIPRFRRLRADMLTAVNAAFALVPDPAVQAGRAS